MTHGRPPDPLKFYKTEFFLPKLFIVGICISKVLTLLKLPDLRQPVRQLRHLAGGLHDCVLRTYFDTFSAFGTVKVINHMDVFCLALNTILRAYIRTFLTAAAQLGVDINIDK